MSALLITVVVPTHDHSELIPFTLRSIQAQTLVEFELFVVGDGAPAATRDAVTALANSDSRIRYFDNRKGEGNGERHRYDALQEASGSLVCYCGDDDLWLPHHLEVLAEELRTADFAHTIQTEVDTEGQVFVRLSDISRADQRDLMVRELFNPFGPTVAGHTMTAYHRLPHGWRARPLGVWSDLHMWRQFFNKQELTFATIPRVTSVKFASARRQDWTVQRREEEIKAWWKRLQQDDFTPWLEMEVLRSISEQAIELEIRAEHSVASHVRRRIWLARSLVKAMLKRD